MSGISLSGLVNGSFNWNTVVSQLIAIDSTPITNLQNDEATNNSQLAALSQLSGDVTSLQTAAQALQADGLFNSVTAASTTVGSSWTATAQAGAAVGSYSIDVSQLATPTTLSGATNAGSPLSTTSDVSALTLATLPTATAVTAGTFTVDGKQVTVALTDSLQQALTAISTATGGKVTGTYDPTTDGITLTSTDSSPIVLGAANDSSNFLSVMKLANNGTATIASSGTLGAMAISSPLSSALLSTPVTGTDGSGNGSFSVNGVAISYNVNTDTVSSIISKINNSTAGVTATYNPSSDNITLTNNSTGDIGVGVSDTTGTLMASLGLTTGATMTQGKNAEYTINGGSQITSLSNSLAASNTGIADLTVNVNSTGTQTISVAPNTTAMNTAIQGFITAFNTLQADITASTQITTAANGSVTTSVLSNNQDVPQWGTDLQNLAFGAVSGLSGTITRLSDLGIDFSGTGNTLSVVDQSTLTNALQTNPSGVAALFQNPTTGLANQFNTYLTNLLMPTTGGFAVAKTALNALNTADAAKITLLQVQINNEQTSLTNEFLAMQNAQSASQSDQAILNGMFGGSSSSSSSTGSTSSGTATVNG